MDVPHAIWDSLRYDFISLNVMIVLIVIVVIVYIIGGLWANNWVTKNFPDSVLENLVVLITTPACILFLLITGALSLIVLPFAVVTHSYRERKFVVRMKELGRYKKWGEKESSIEDGTLIIEQVQKEQCRVWWTVDDVARNTPHPIPNEEELDYLWSDEPLKFVEWCFEKYLSDDGQAHLI